MTPESVLVNIKGYSLWGIQDYPLCEEEARTVIWALEECLGISHDAEGA